MQAPTEMALRAHQGGHAYAYNAEFTHETTTSEHLDISQIVNDLCLPQNIFMILSYGDFGMYLKLNSQTKFQVEIFEILFII